MLLCGGGGVGSGIALVDIGKFHHSARDLLDLLGQGRNLIASALIGRRDSQGQQVAQRVHGYVDLEPASWSNE